MMVVMGYRYIDCSDEEEGVGSGTYYRLEEEGEDYDDSDVESDDV